jgi:hypothetical protein
MQHSFMTDKYCMFGHQQNEQIGNIEPTPWTSQEKITIGYALIKSKVKFY